jgi:hypothetical protein
MEALDYAKQLTMEIFGITADELNTAIVNARGRVLTTSGQGTVRRLFPTTTRTRLRKKKRKAQGKGRKRRSSTRIRKSKY